MEALQYDLRGKYTNLEDRRRPFLERGREVAALTMPYLLTREGHSSGFSDFPTPYQSVGAEGVSNLASKLLLSLFPPNAPFFRLKPDEYALEQLSESLGSANEATQTRILDEIEQSLISTENAVMLAVEQKALRVTIFECLKHLIVTGNGLLYIPRAGKADRSKMRLYHIDQYVVERDSMGNLEVVITKEMVSPATLPESVRMHISTHLAMEPGAHQLSNDKEVEIYTGACRLPDGMFRVSQNIEGVEIPETVGTFTEENLPYLPLRFSKVSKESYGRGLGEERLGDLRSLEGLSRAIVEGAAAASRVVGLVRPNGSTRLKDLNKTKNGGFAAGNADDVQFLQVNKFADFRTAESVMDKIERRLQKAFLLTSSIQRQAERVTAEEIRLLAEQLEATLGGTYSILSQELQLPIVNHLMDQLRSEGSLPPWPSKLKKTIKPVIVTGVDALGRGQELERLRVASLTAAEILQNPTVAQMLNTETLLQRIYDGAGVPTEGLVKSQEQMAQEQQQAQMQQAAQAMIDKGTGPMVGAGTKAAMEQQAAPAEAV